MIQILRNNHLESIHYGSAIVVGPGNKTIVEWGDTTMMIFPRSAMKILQAIPLLESGAASIYKLGAQELAIACSSHQGSPIHINIIKKWLTEMSFSEQDLKCGVQPPFDRFERQKLKDCGKRPTQLHNNCSGKHVGFLTYVKHNNLCSDYIDVNHPLQRNIRLVLEELSGEEINEHGIDGCSAPNFRCSLRGLAKAMYALTDLKRLGRIRFDSVEQLLMVFVNTRFL